MAATIAPQPLESATPSASPTAASTVAPPAGPAALPSAEESPEARPGATDLPAAAPATPTPSPYHFRFVPRQPDNPAPGTPQIFAVYLNSKTLVSNGPILIKVTTDAGTVKVTSRSSGRINVIPMVAPGDFEANGRLPKIPFIAAGMTVALEFTAVGADGSHVTVSVPVALK